MSCNKLSNEKEMGRLLKSSSRRILYSRRIPEISEALADSTTWTILLSRKRTRLIKSLTLRSDPFYSNSLFF
jgi:hypothetical protein